MPKIKRRPTRAQASILRALETNRGLRVIYNGRGAAWQGVAWPIVKREIGDPRVSTMRKMIAEEWLETDDPGGVHWRLSDFGRRVLMEHGLPLLAAAANVTADDLVAMLRRRYKDAWAIVTEVPVLYFQRARRIDAVAVPLIRKENSIGFELKVDRGDFLRELEDPSKYLTGMALFNHFYFVAPPGIVKNDELPEDCGLILADQIHGSEPVEAPWLGERKASWDLIAALSSRLVEL